MSRRNAIFPVEGRGGWEGSSARHSYKKFGGKKAFFVLLRIYVIENDMSRYVICENDMRYVKTICQ